MNNPRPARRAWLVVAVVGALLASGCGFTKADVQARADRRDRPGGSGASSGSDSGGSAADTGSASSDPSTSDTATGGGAIPPAPGRYHARLTKWKGCHGRFQCATLVVPLDWQKPDGQTIDLAVIRLRHQGNDRRIGSVVFNPGGPGGSGVDFLHQSLAPAISKALSKHFDLVSWDPRGTGESQGISCATDVELAKPDLDPAPNTPEAVAATEARARQRLTECQQKAGADLLAHVGTRDTVRDLDALRFALGDKDLTYVGYSYGTTIGTEYAAMFGSHIRAMALDGIAIPGEDVIKSSHDQGLAFENALGQFFDDCRAKGCPFGGNDPKGALVAFQARLHAGARIPAVYDYTAGLKRTATLGIGELDVALVQAMYDKSLWPVLQQGLAKALDPVHPDGGDLLLLRDLYTGRQEDGSWKSILDANSAITCADTPTRATSAVGDPQARAVFADLPILGPLIAAGQPGCYLQPPPLDPLKLPADGSIKGTPPVVIVSSTGDPATPYESGVRLTKIITHSVLITGENTQHTAYGRGSGCIDDPVDRYLTDRQVPRTGLTCQLH